MPSSHFVPMLNILLLLNRGNNNLIHHMHHMHPCNPCHHPRGFTTKPEITILKVKNISDRHFLAEKGIYLRYALWGVSIPSGHEKCIGSYWCLPIWDEICPSETQIGYLLSLSETKILWFHSNYFGQPCYNDPILYTTQIIIHEHSIQLTAPMYMINISYNITYHTGCSRHWCQTKSNITWLRAKST